MCMLTCVYTGVHGHPHVCACVSVLVHGVPECVHACARVCTQVSNPGEYHSFNHKRPRATASNTSSHVRLPRNINQQYCPVSPRLLLCGHPGILKDSKLPTEETIKDVFINNNNTSYYILSTARRQAVDQELYLCLLSYYFTPIYERKRPRLRRTAKGTQRAASGWAGI